MGIDEATTEQRSRRAILVGAIGGLAGLVGSRIAWPDEADAAAGHAMLLGRANSAGTKNTSLVTKTTGHAFKVTQKGTGTRSAGSNTLGTAISGATANKDKFGLTPPTPPRRLARAQRSTPGRRESRSGSSPALRSPSAPRRPATDYGVSGTGGYSGLQGVGGDYGAILSGTAVGAYASGASYGLYGSGGAYGLVATGSTYGAFGSGTTGVYGSGSTYGVFGTTSNPNTDGVRGDGGQYAVHGVNGRTAGMRGDSGYVGRLGAGHIVWRLRALPPTA